MSDRWHWFCRSVGLVSPDGNIVIHMISRFGRLKAVHVIEDGDTRCLTPAQFRFWARGKGLIMNTEHHG